MFPITKTVRSFSEAKIKRYIIYDILIAILIGGIFTYLSIYYSNKFANIETSWLNSIFSYFTGTMAIIISWFMLPILVPLIAGFFEEMVIKKVEDNCYPENKTRDAKFWPDMIHDIKFTFLSLFLNILIIPFYFLGIGFIISILLNSFLLGTEFFEIAAGYTLGKKEASKLRKKNRFKVYTGGLIITLITLVPILNLTVPIIATVWMLHLYHNIENIT